MQSYGEIIEDLQKVEVYVYPDAECERVHALTGPTNRSCHLCAGVPGGGKGQCSVRFKGERWFFRIEGCIGL